VVGVVISIYYYFGWIREAFFQSISLDDDLRGVRAHEEAPQIKTPLGLNHRIILGALTILTVLLGVWQGAFTGGF
jgi:NADH-quinone oxidoreductase subunit N